MSNCQEYLERSRHRLEKISTCPLHVINKIHDGSDSVLSSLGIDLAFQDSPDPTSTIDVHHFDVLGRVIGMESVYSRSLRLSARWTPQPYCTTWVTFTTKARSLGGMTVVQSAEVENRLQQIKNVDMIVLTPVVEDEVLVFVFTKRAVPIRQVGGDDDGLAFASLHQLFVAGNDGALVKLGFVEGWKSVLQTIERLPESEYAIHMSTLFVGSDANLLSPLGGIEVHGLQTREMEIERIRAMIVAVDSGPCPRPSSYIRFQKIEGLYPLDRVLRFCANVDVDTIREILRMNVVPENVRHRVSWMAEFWIRIIGGEIVKNTNGKVVCYDYRDALEDLSRPEESSTDGEA